MSRSGKHPHWCGGGCTPLRGCTRLQHAAPHSRQRAPAPSPALPPGPADQVRRCRRHWTQEACAWQSPSLPGELIELAPSARRPRGAWAAALRCRSCGPNACAQWPSTAQAQFNGARGARSSPPPWSTLVACTRQLLDHAAILSHSHHNMQQHQSLGRRCHHAGAAHLAARHPVRTVCGQQRSARIRVLARATAHADGQRARLVFLGTPEVRQQRRASSHAGSGPRHLQLAGPASPAGGGHRAQGAGGGLPEARLSVRGAQAVQRAAPRTPLSASPSTPCPAAQLPRRWWRW